ncbi:MAG: DUF167 domain-containing protein [Candidatus Binatia bacterium]
MSFKIWITARPQAKKQQLMKVADDEYRASVHAPAKDSKANQALVTLLAEHFAVPKSAVKICRGSSSRKKLIQIG